LPISFIFNADYSKAENGIGNHLSVGQLLRPIRFHLQM